MITLALRYVACSVTIEQPIVENLYLVGNCHDNVTWKYFAELFQWKHRYIWKMISFALLLPMGRRFFSEICVVNSTVITACLMTMAKGLITLFDFLVKNEVIFLNLE